MYNTWFIREKYYHFTILAGIFIFEKDWPVHLFLLNTFEAVFESIVCLFVCFQQLANCISENWEMCELFLSSLITCYFFCIRSSSILSIVHKVVQVTAKLKQSSKRGRKKKQYVIRRSEVKVWKMTDKWYVIFVYMYMPKVYILPAST